MCGLGKERMGGLRCLSFHCFVASKGSFFKHCTSLVRDVNERESTNIILIFHQTQRSTDAFLE